MRHLITIYPFLKMLLALCFGIIGAQVFVYLKLPIPWILGAIVASAIASRFESLPIARPQIFTGPARTVLGVTIGSAFTPSVVQGLITYLPSLLLIIPFVIIIAICGGLYYWKIVGFDKKTAYFSAMPGGLMEMVSIGEEMGANLARITLTQSTRLLLIVFTLPFVLEMISHVDLGGRGAITPPVSQVPLHDLIAMVLIAIVGAWGAKRLKVSGAYIIGPMVLGAAVYILGLVEARPPDEALKLTQLVLGTSIGFVFRGVKTKEVLITLVQTFGYFLLLSTISAIFIAIVYYTFDFPLISIIMAFSPGGQAEMNLIAIILGANVPFVALHHLIRLFLVLGISPIFAKMFQKL